jgi:response regulator NasT
VLLLGTTSSYAAPLAQSTGWRISVATHEELVETYRTGQPDAVLLSDADFQVHGASLFRIRQTPIVCIGADQLEAASNALDHGASGWLTYEASPTAVAMQVELAIRWAEKLEALTSDKQLLMQMLETRKLVERAKAIFMKRMKIDEPEAHRRLQRESQNRRIGLAELAKRIIESDEIMTA